jgi:hypothetical protein
MSENVTRLFGHLMSDNEVIWALQKENERLQVRIIELEKQLEDESYEATRRYAKIGIYGIDLKAFARIDQFITHYNDAVSAGKVSVDVKRELTDAEIEELGAQEAEKRDKK